MLKVAPCEKVRSVLQQYGKENIILEQGVTYNENGAYYDEIVDNSQLSTLNSQLVDGSRLQKAAETCDVIIAGSRAGKEAVLLYSSDLIASVVPDNKRLRDFTKIELQPGETKTVTFQLPAKALAFVGADGKWTLEEGDFLLKIGSQSVRIACSETKVWDPPNI